MVDHSSASLFPSGRVRAWRERTGDLSQWTLYWCWQNGPQWQGCASKTCVRGRGPGHVNQHHSGCRFSGSVLDTRERQEGKDKGKRWALFWKYVRTLLFLWDMSFFWALCAAESLKCDKQARKLGRNITAVLLSQWKRILLVVTMLQSEVWLIECL